MKLEKWKGCLCQHHFVEITSTQTKCQYFTILQMRDVLLREMLFEEAQSILLVIEVILGDIAKLRLNRHVLNYLNSLM